MTKEDLTSGRRLSDKALVVIDSPATAIAIVAAAATLMLYLIGAETAPQELRIKTLECTTEKMESQLININKNISEINSSLKVLAAKEEANH